MAQAMTTNSLQAHAKTIRALQDSLACVNTNRNKSIHRREKTTTKRKTQSEQKTPAESKEKRSQHNIKTDKHHQRTDVDQRRRTGTHQVDDRNQINNNNSTTKVWNENEERTLMAATKINTKHSIKESLEDQLEDDDKTVTPRSRQQEHSKAPQDENWFPITSQSFCLLSVAC